MTDPFSSAFVCHLIGDWILQNEWMANNKSNPRHLSGYIHASIHTLLLLSVFTPLLAITVGVIHYLIDLRHLTKFWQKFYRQTNEGQMGIHVAIWLDQTLHIVVLFVACRIWG